jgi:hypothetical protein
MLSFKTCWYDKNEGIVCLYSEDGMKTIRYIDVSTKEWKDVTREVKDTQRV